MQVAQPQLEAIGMEVPKALRDLEDPPAISGWRTRSTRCPSTAAWAPEHVNIFFLKKKKKKKKDASRKTNLEWQVLFDGGHQQRDLPDRQAALGDALAVRPARGEPALPGAR